MLDPDGVAGSPASVACVLKAAGLLERHQVKPTKQGTGFEQPLKARDHGPVDVAYLNRAGTFYSLGSLPDGYRRSILHGEIREPMKEAEIE